MFHSLTFKGAKIQNQVQVHEQRSENICLWVNHPYMTERHRDGITLSSTKGHPHSTPPAPISFAYLTDVPLLDNYANIFPRGSPESSSKVIYTSNIKMQKTHDIIKVKMVSESKNVNIW